MRQLKARGLSGKTLGLDKQGRLANSTELEAEDKWRRAEAAKKEAALAAAQARAASRAADGNLEKMRALQKSRETASREALERASVREHSSALELCGPHVSCSSAMLRSSNRMAQRPSSQTAENEARAASMGARWMRKAKDIEADVGAVLGETAALAFLEVQTEQAAADLARKEQAQKMLARAPSVLKLQRDEEARAARGEEWQEAIVERSAVRRIGSHAVALPTSMYGGERRDVKQLLFGVDGSRLDPHRGPKQALRARKAREQLEVYRLECERRRHAIEAAVGSGLHGIATPL